MNPASCKRSGFITEETKMPFATGIFVSFGLNEWQISLVSTWQACIVYIGVGDRA